MKIYFAASIRGGRNDDQIYFSIVDQLRAYGTVLTEHIGGLELTSFGENTDDRAIRAETQSLHGAVAT